MVKVVGVRFRNAGKIYYFGPGKLDIHAGMHVIVETARGVELGTVMTEPKGVSEEEVRRTGKKRRMPSASVLRRLPSTSSI